MIKKARILLIGPKPKANKVGGARVSFAQLEDYMIRHNYPHQVIETQPYASGWKKIWNPLQLLTSFVINIWRTEIVWLNVSQGGTRFLAPLVYVLTKLFRKKFVFRPFGSSLQDDYQKYGRLQKYWFQKTALQADVLFLQTHSAIHFFRPLSKNIKHLPTSRPVPAQVRSQRVYQRRFVFLGHIKTSKGIDEMLAAIQQLNETYTIHLYGPIMEDKYEYLHNDSHSIYQGVLTRSQVSEQLSKYDVLLLPTYFSGEGYPGAIIEAYSLGLPVITTRWRAIPEIVKDGETGLLIEPRNTKHLRNAIQSFNAQNYERFSTKAKAHFQENFAQEQVLEKILTEVNTSLNFD